MSKAIVSNQSQILYLLPQGKPDPKIPCSKANLHTRPLVAQVQQKGPTCMYYAMNMIRNRIGKNPTEELLPERKIEQMISSHRKKITELYKKYQTQSLLSIIKNNSNNLIRDNIDIFDNDIEKISVAIAKGSAAEVLQLAEQLAATLCTREEITIHRCFLREMGYSPHEEAIAASPINMNSVEASKEPLAVCKLVDQVYAKEYRLLASTWKPKEEVVGLLEALKANGPMLVGGYNGIRYYKRDFLSPSPSAIAGIEKCAFRELPELGRVENKDVAHAVVVVGAQMTQDHRGLVYFVDPNDRREPGAEQTVYVRAYDRFAEDVGCLTSSYVGDWTLIGLLKALWDVVFSIFFSGSYGTYGFHGEMVRSYTSVNPEPESLWDRTCLFFRKLFCKEENSLEGQPPFANSLVLPEPPLKISK